MGSLQTAFKTLDEEIKMTGRRVNALEYVIIPKIEDIMKYIEQEMDEQAREEFFRVKKVVEKKKIKMAKDRQEIEEYAADKVRKMSRQISLDFDKENKEDLVF